MKNIKLDKWNESYARDEHSVLFPKEECVKFLSRFVRAKRSDGSFIEKYNKSSPLKGLDFGCGMGVQTQLLHDFHIESYGVDIVELAITRAQQVNPKIADRFKLIEPGKQIPFQDNQFDITICEAVLDSMTFELASKAIQELDRVTNGLVFISLISNKCNTLGHFKAQDEVVEIAHENGTIQSYYDKERIERLLLSTQFNITWHTLHLHYDKQESNVNNARYYIVLDNR